MSAKIAPFMCRLCLGTCVFFLVFHGSEAAVSRKRNDLQRNRLISDRNIINNVEKAQEMLQRYGYLKCRVSRKRRHPSFSHPFPPGIALCSQNDIKEGARLYQRHYKLPVTGRLDSNTLSMMSRSRCGNPDIGDYAEMLPILRTQLISSILSSSSLSASLANISERNKIALHSRIRSRRRILKKKQILLKLDKFQTRPQIVSELHLSPINSRTRRKRWIQERVNAIESGQHSKALEVVHEQLIEHRKKRSLSAEMIEAFAQDVITWRLLRSGYSNQMNIPTQRAALALAFRMWSEVIPPIFAEDVRSHIDDVDILIAFGKGEHMNCPNNFDGMGGQLSHAMKSDGASEIHVDDDEYFTVGSEIGTNFLKVAVHEVGHVLGLHHAKRNQSIMYAIYSEVLPSRKFELGWDDRKLIQNIYGICRLSFDMIFDWVRKRPDGQFIYNTFFFRENRHWLYENRFNRTRYGDPIAVHMEWKGLPNNMDGFAHLWGHTMNKALFFKGHQYWQYDGLSDQVAPRYPRNISDDFKAKPNSIYPDIPRNLDAVFFDKRDGNLYFFKGTMVYAYDVNKGTAGCCLKGYPRLFKEEFPTHALSVSIEGHVDCAYYSYADRAMYIFKGTQFWHNVAFRLSDRKRTNLLIGPFEIHEKWFDICDVEIPNR